MPLRLSKEEEKEEEEEGEEEGTVKGKGKGEGEDVDDNVLSCKQNLWKKKNTKYCIHLQNICILLPYLKSARSDLNTLMKPLFQVLHILNSHFLFFDE